MNINRLSWVNLISHPFNTILSLLLMTFGVGIISLILLLNNQIGCEWPIGHPNEIDFHYCGKDRIDGKPYCEEHCSTAYIMPDTIKNEELKTAS